MWHIETWPFFALFFSKQTCHSNQIALKFIPIRARFRRQTYRPHDVRKGHWRVQADEGDVVVRFGDEVFGMEDHAFLLARPLLNARVVQL